MSSSVTMVVGVLAVLIAAIGLSEWTVAWMRRRARLRRRLAERRQKDERGER